MSRIPFGSARHLATLVALIGLLALAAPAAAQDTGTQLTVGAILCQDVDCIDHGTLVPEFTVFALDSATGDVLATCTTDAGDPHLCTLSLPAGADWTLAWDDAQIPEGYAWRGDLYPVADGPLGTATLIPLVPVQEPQQPDSTPTEPPIVIEEPGHITVQAGLCTDATCHEISEFLDLFIISAVDPDTGEEFSSCATGNAQQGLPHQCILDVPADGDFALTWSPDQVPAGYASFGDPFPVGDPAVLTLGFVPETAPTVAPTIAPTRAPITTLPSTGAGPGGGATGLLLATLLTIAGACLTALALAAHNRRRAPAAIRHSDIA
jgi:hypothetical protein